MGLSGIGPKSWHESECFSPSRPWCFWMWSSLKTLSFLFLRMICSYMPFHMHGKVFPNVLLQGSLCLPGAALQLDSAAGWPHIATGRLASHACIFVCIINQRIVELPICSGRATLRSRSAWSLAHCSHHKLNLILCPGWETITSKDKPRVKKDLRAILL